MILRIFSVIGDVIPFVGSLIAFGTGLVSFVMAIAVGVIVIAIGWFAVRPLLSIGLLVGVAAIVWAYSKYGRKPPSRLQRDHGTPVDRRRMGFRRRCPK